MITDDEFDILPEEDGNDFVELCDLIATYVDDLDEIDQPDAEE